jgi:hypothetical protein
VKIKGGVRRRRTERLFERGGRRSEVVCDKALGRRSFVHGGSRCRLFRFEAETREYRATVVGRRGGCETNATYFLACKWHLKAHVSLFNMGEGNSSVPPRPSTRTRILNVTKRANQYL